MPQDAVWDLFTFIAYMSISLEIVIFALGLHKQLVNQRITAGKLIFLAIAFLFVAFIVCCGITHFLSFMLSTECAKAEFSRLPYCLGINESGPMSATITFFKAMT